MLRRLPAIWIGLSVLVLGTIQAAHAQCVGAGPIYTCSSEIDYRNKLSELGFSAFSEGFEDSATWGGVRAPSGASSVTSQNIDWTPNHPLPNQITTGLGGAFTGSYGVYDKLHGSAVGSAIECDINNPPEPCLYYDGVTGTRTAGASLLYGVGGYIRGAFGASIEIRTGANLHGLGQLPDNSHHFFGVIDTAGFSDFWVRELEGKVGQPLSIFADDFVFGVAAGGANSAPVANAGLDQTGFVGDTITLDGSASSDADGDALTYSWSLSTVPAGSGAALSVPTATSTTFVIDLPGTYVAQLIVNDGLIDSPPDTVIITTTNSAPVANAGPDQARLVGDTVILNGSASSDVDGDPITFAWSLNSVPAGSAAALSDPTVASPSFLIDLPGTYVAQLIVNDGLADSTPDTVTINATANSAPVANAGPDQTGLVGDTITLDGSGSTDVDGDALSYSWSLTSVPAGSTASLSDPTAIMPSFTLDVFGTYVAQLIVNDGTTDSVADTVQISTDNSAPVANAGPDQTGFVGDTMTLDGSGSSDVDGDTLTYSWSLTSVPLGSTAALSNPTAVMPTFTLDVFGTYVAQLIVNDGTTDSVADTVQISTDNSAPVANAGPDQTGLVGDTMTLDGSGSTDVDGDALSYSWSLTSVPAGSTASLSDPTAVMPSFTIDVFGTYVAQLIVNDGTTDSVADTVQISTDNSAPVANAGLDQTAFVGDTATLNGSGSSDVDGDPLSFAWSLSSVPVGSTATLSDPTAMNPSFVIDAPGTYTAQLIVNDGLLGSAPDTVTITTDNSAPVANAGPDQTGLVGDTVTLDGTGSTDVDGDTLTYSWSLTSVPLGSTATLSDPTAAMPTFTLDVFGTYVVQLIVNDGALDSPSPATVTLTVADVPPPDTDLDGVPDSSDNCLLLANADQRDSDGDGYGNRCDADFNNDGKVNAIDVAIMRRDYGTAGDQQADLNADNKINAVDVAILRSLYGVPPGPSALAL